MISRKTTTKTAIWLLLLFPVAEIPLHAQGIGGRYGRRQGRREGSIVLPTPPFNPNAGILSRPNGRGRNSPKVTPRRSVRRRPAVSNRNPHPTTPRRRRVRRRPHR
ncbi:MAG TPA: hypothetical protein VIW80_23145 [Pyrinomonadaceae bacterium]